MPRALSQRLLRLTGLITVVAILGFLVLPAIVVTLAAFNSRSILSFPPETWSLRWFIKALAYEDFQAGFRNGLIVTAWASTIALAVGAAFAFALDRYQFRLKRAIEAVLLSPLVIPHFTIGLGFLIIAAQLGMARSYVTVIACHVILVLPTGTDAARGVMNLAYVPRLVPRTSPGTTGSWCNHRLHPLNLAPVGRRPAIHDFPDAACVSR